MVVKKNKTTQNAYAEQEPNKTNCLNIQEAHWVEAWFQFIQSQNIPVTQCTDAQSISRKWD